MNLQLTIKAEYGNHTALEQDVNIGIDGVDYIRKELSLPKLSIDVMGKRRS